MSLDKADILFFWTETSLHAGSGSSVGAVDLPIQRDRQTGHPIVQYGGVKGVLRDYCGSQWEKDEIKCIFGPESANASDHAGAVSFSTARILLFPIRSLRGLFAWITCPYALALLQRDYERTGAPAPFTLPEGIAEGKAWVTKDAPLLINNEEIVLEEYAFKVEPKQEVGTIAKWLACKAMPCSTGYEYWQKRLFNDDKSHLVILNDDDFSELVEQCTEVVQRIKVNADTGTVKDTGLWTEENLPADSLLYSVMHVLPPRCKEMKLDEATKKLRETLKDNTLIQMGGNETVGRGLTRIRHLKGGK